MADSVSDSDETRGSPSDSDVTLSPDTRDLMNRTPDLFAEFTDDKNEKSYRKKSSVLPKIGKRHSKAHEISDDESDDNSNSMSVSKRKQYEHSVKKDSDTKLTTVDQKKKIEKANTNLTNMPRTSERKQFLNSFLDMSDSSTDDEEDQDSVKYKQTPLKADHSALVNKAYKKDYSKPIVQMSSATSTKNDESLKKRHSEKKEKPSGSSPVSLKRKHSKSTVPQEHSKSRVPQELRKAVTDILMANKNTNLEKKLPPCQYGSKCYRKNPSHFEEFSHNTEAENGKSISSPPKKKFKRMSDSPVPGSSRTPSQSPCTSSKTTKPPHSQPKSVTDKLQQAQPYCFFLTKVAGIEDKYNGWHVMDIKDILSPEMGNLTASCQFNFMFDIPWLMKQYPSQFRSKPLLLVHGEQGASKASLQAQAMTFSNIKFCQARLEMMYGTHHTKMMLLLYDSCMRVVIHTSNLIQQDWHQKTQGMWISPAFPKLQAPSQEKGDSPTKFKQDLLAYLAAYKAYQLKEWIEHIKQHDMSTARVVIIGSVPGRHIGDQAKSSWGHLKLRKVLQKHGPKQDIVKTWPVIGQFSSIGSMGPNKDSWVCGEFLQSLSAAKAGTGIQSNSRLQLVFPSKDNVRLSLEGFPAGGSIPYSVTTAKKQTYLHDFFHRWKSDGRGRSRAMPHIKTYIRPKQDGSQAAWFVVTSANLSKAAWGALEKKGTQLMIRSYEIGVLMLPKFMVDLETFTVTSDVANARLSNSLALPYDLPVQIYDKKDRPWMWDIPYMDLPDTNGNVWCPFSK